MGYIKGITIQIDGETKGLDAALKKINTAKCTDYFAIMDKLGYNILGELHNEMRE